MSGNQSDGTKKRACEFFQWEACQFSGDSNVGLVDEGGKTYCVFHARKASKAVSVESLAYALRKYFDLRGVHFSAGKHKFENKGKVKYDLRGCSFAPKVGLRLSPGHYDFTGVRFPYGVSILLTDGSVTLAMDEVVASGRIKVRCAAEDTVTGFAADWSAQHATFDGELDLKEVQFRGSLNFDRAEFFRALRLDDAKFPQMTSFHRAQFGPESTPANAEGSYRHARQYFKEKGHRDAEGIFYALEKRSHRNRLERWSVSHWINRVYDEVAEYGQNYVRPLGAFCLLQLIAYESYLLLAFGTWKQGLTIDSLFSPAAGAFTLAQVVKPFEMLGSKNPDSWFYRELFSSGTTGVPLLLGSILHSVASITFATLFILALRWRFRRE